MELKTEQIAQQAADIAKRSGAQNSRIIVTRERFISLTQSNGVLESIEESSSATLSAQLFVDGRYSTHTSNDLRPEALKSFFSQAVAMTRLLTGDAHRILPPAELYQGYQDQELKLLDPAHASVTMAQRRERAQQLESSIEKSRGKLNHAEAGIYDSQTESVLVNTNGFLGRAQSTVYSVSINMTASDAQGHKSRDGDAAVSRFYGECPALQTIGERGLQRTLEALGAKPIKTQKLPMIVENRVAGRLLRNLMMPMNASALQQKQSFLEGKKGQLLFSPLLTMVDDPFILGGLGSRTFDSEGIPARKRTMIEKGVLQEFWIDTYYGNKLGWKPTSGSSSNLVFQGGERDLEALMKSVGKGILVTGFLGGNSNSTTGDFSLGVNGFYFENGQKAQPIAEMNVSGNQLEFWKQLVELGSDPYPYSSVRAPSLLFNDVLFSGV